MTVFGEIVLASWLIFLLYWLLNWGNVKPTIGKRTIWTHGRIFGAVLIICAILISRKFQIVYKFNVPNVSPIIGTIGVVLAATGLIVAILARRTLGSNWSSRVELKKGHELVTNGIYSVVRHPIYLGLLLIESATVIVFQSLPPVIIFTFGLIVFMRRIKNEEVLMLKTFPKNYHAYMKRTKALIPFLY